MAEDLTIEQFADRIVAGGLRILDRPRPNFDIAGAENMFRESYYRFLLAGSDMEAYTRGVVSTDEQVRLKAHNWAIRNQDPLVAKPLRPSRSVNTV